MKQEMPHEGSQGIAHTILSPSYEGTISSTFMNDECSTFHNSC